MGISQQPAGLELPLADERLRVDDEPRLSLRGEDVGAVQILIHENRRGAIDREVHVQRVLEEMLLERPIPIRVPPRQLLVPAVGLRREQREAVVTCDVDL